MDDGRRAGRGVKVAAIQMDCILGDREANLSKAEEGLIRQAAGQGADLAVLPELFLYGYSMAEEGSEFQSWSQMERPSNGWNGFPDNIICIWWAL